MLINLTLLIVGMHALINRHEYHLCDMYAFVGCWMSCLYSLIQCRQYMCVSLRLCNVVTWYKHVTHKANNYWHWSNSKIEANCAFPVVHSIYATTSSSSSKYAIALYWISVRAKFRSVLNFGLFKFRSVQPTLRPVIRPDLYRWAEIRQCRVYPSS